MPGFNREILRLAARQEQNLTRDQLLEAGLSQSSIGRRVEAGSMQRQFPGVYLLSYAAPTQRQRIWAASLYGGADAAISHETAGVIWRMLQRYPNLIDLTFAGRNPGTPDGINVHRTRAWRPGDTVVLNGIRVTSSIRTLLDIAASSPIETVEDALTEGIVHENFGVSDVLAAIEVDPTRKGVARLQEIIEDQLEYGYTRSRAERLLRTILEPSGLPMPRLNEPLEHFLVDAVWYRERLVIEVVGYGTHGKRGPYEDDALREQILLAAGFRPMRVTWRQLRRTPQAVLLRIAQALAVQFV